MSPDSEKRSRRVPGGLLGTTAILTMALAAGCGKGDDVAPRSAEPEVAATSDSVPAPVEDATPVPLPDDFPADVPLPPGATIVSAQTASDETGTAASATLVTTVDEDDTLSWYARALAAAGWQIAERGPRSLHAIRGESYADVTMTGTDPDRTVLEVRIWTVGR